MDHNLSAADCRRLAAKCRRFAQTMSNSDTAALLRQMAAEYESLASATEKPLNPEPPPILLYAALRRWPA